MVKFDHGEFLITSIIKSISDDELSFSRKKEKKFYNQKISLKTEFVVKHTLSIEKVGVPKSK